VVAGESAGGNLTLALVLKLRQRGLALPAGMYLLSPWLDLTQSGESYDICAARDPMVSRAVLQGLADSYCGNAPAAKPLISPLFADLAGLPPVFVQAGGDEVLLGDSTRLAHRFALAGGDVTLRVWPEMVHAWPLFQHVIPVAGNAAIAEAGQWISNRLSVGLDR
jgi:acetyl esterase/lipase